MAASVLAAGAGQGAAGAEDATGEVSAGLGAAEGAAEGAMVSASCGESSHSDVSEGYSKVRVSESSNCSFSCNTACPHVTASSRPLLHCTQLLVQAAPLSNNISYVVVTLTYIVLRG